jgi:hypothetical protein
MEILHLSKKSAHLNSIEKCCIYINKPCPIINSTINIQSPITKSLKHY